MAAKDQWRAASKLGNGYIDEGNAGKEETRCEDGGERVLSLRTDRILLDNAMWKYVVTTKLS